MAQLPANHHPRRIVFESKLEQRVLHLLLARQDIFDIWDQPPAVEYQDGLARRRRHVFDYLVTLICGRRIAVAVKPSPQVSRRRFREKLEHIRAATPLEFAHDVALVTENHFTADEALNAARLHDFRRTADPEADESVCSIILKCSGETTIASVVSQSGLAGRAFRAAFRAIYDGCAAADCTAEITPSTRILARRGLQ
ncbi:TnsA endonuclease N-terminal domain-containing protein [Phyllobacterium sp. 0TCS1.6C]|nr:TnsA endonuclease N-terminal domain-containing protein [Phyllobacterium sp. 0TCS1.6C]